MRLLTEIVEHMKGKKVLVYGDFMYDVYHWGRVTRICPEAPVPVFVEDCPPETRPGGAYNVCQNLAELGCVPTQLAPLDRLWSVKRRFMQGSHLLLRVDQDQILNGEPIVSHEVERMGEYDAIVISDYAKGWVTRAGCVEIINAALAHDVPVIVDPKGTDWDKYAGFTVICPNETERASVRAVRLEAGNMIAKLGAGGLDLITTDAAGVQHRDHYAATAQAVFDVTGAGDTVCAVVAAALAADADLRQACQLANLGAGHVIGEVGTSAIDAETLDRLVRESVTAS